MFAVLLAIGVAGLKDKHAVGCPRLPLIAHSPSGNPAGLLVACLDRWLPHGFYVLHRPSSHPTGLHPDVLRAIVEPQASQSPDHPAARGDGAAGGHQRGLADPHSPVHGRALQKTQTRAARREPFLHRGIGAGDRQARSPGPGPCGRDGATSDWMAVSQSGCQTGFGFVDVP